MNVMSLVAVLPLADTWGMHGDAGAGWWVVMMVLMVLFWAAVIFGILWLVRGGFERRSGPRTEAPVDVLERRFAEGAISVDEYQTRRELLGNGASQRNGAQQEESPTTPLAGEGRQR